MAYYRVYLLDATDHIVEGRNIESDGDITAIASAAAAARTLAVEVWNGVRKVAYLPAEISDALPSRSERPRWVWHLTEVSGN